MNQFESYRLTAFNVAEQIDLKETFGLIKIFKSDDGKVVLIREAAYGSFDQNQPTPLKIGRIDAALGFVLDIGIRREQQLTGAGGFYFGFSLLEPQSLRPVTQRDFDPALLEKIKSSIDALYQSGDPEKELAAIKLNYLIETYNDARLLYPSFFNESYLSLLRILDAVGLPRGANEFALTASRVSAVFNKQVHDKITEIPAYGIRLALGAKIFARQLQACKRSNRDLAEAMEMSDDAAQLVFSCFYSAYQYRNKFVHYGLPFPDTVAQILDPSGISGTAYLNPVLGRSLLRRYSPKGVGSDDIIDIERVVGGDAVSEFKEYFQVLPTWYFLKQLVRECLLIRIGIVSHGVIDKDLKNSNSE